MKLTDKQSAFCEEYMIDLNATQAAIRAGYSKHTSHAIGQENLSKPIIASRITELKEKRSKSTEVTAERVVAELALLAYDHDKHDNTRLKGLELLGKHVDIFNNDKVDANIILNITHYSDKKE